MRAGTVNVAGVVALATALRITARAPRRGDRAHRRRCATGCRPGCSPRCPDAFVNGDVEHRTAGHLHVGFPGVESEALLVLLDQQGLCAAAGQLLLVGRHRDLARARGDGHGPRPRPRRRSGSASGTRRPRPTSTAPWR